MSFKEFDLSDYMKALEDFKTRSTDTIVKHWGSIENFDIFIQKIKDDESEVAKLAIQEFGSVEKYTEAMKYNLEHFSEIMDTQLTKEAKKVGQQSDMLYAKLTADMSKDVSSSEVQSIVQSIDLLIQENGSSVSLDKPYLNIIIDTYASDYVKKITDTKYGEGASDYIVKAFRYYSENYTSKDK